MRINGTEYHLHATAACSTFRIEEMNWRDFAALPDHRCQRNTEAHLRRAKHLQQSHDSHRFVAIVALIEGGKVTEVAKCDGHTRAMKWLTSGEGPGELECRVHICHSEEEYVQWYHCYDSSTAAENAVDLVASAAKSRNFRFRVPFPCPHYCQRG